MLSHNDIHYLVGLLASAGTPEDVDLELGALVYDDAERKKRDLDIAIRRRVSAGAEAYLGMEVKDEKRPLHVDKVEQLVRKLNDMGELTIRAIVSASGYSDGARNKAEYHGVDLLRLDKWDSGSREVGVTFAPGFSFERRTLFTELRHVSFEVEWKEGEAITECDLDWPVTTVAGEPIAGVATLSALNDYVSKVAVSQCVGNPAIEAIEIGRSFEHAQTVILQDTPLIWAGTRAGHVKAGHFSGRLVWKGDRIKPDFRVLVHDKDDSPFLGCAVAEGIDGGLMGVAFKEAPSPLTYFALPVSERNKTKIKELKLRSGKT